MSDHVSIPTIKHVWLALVHIVIYGGFAIWAGTPLGWISLIFAGLLIWVSFTDFLVYEVPDSAVIALVLSGVSVHWWTGDGVVWSVSAVVVWSAGFYGIARLARRLLREDGLGMGDVKLMAGIAAWLGMIAPIYVVLCASVAGIGVIVLTQMRQGDRLSRKVVAFGPFLCLSAWVVWLSGAGV